MAKKLNIVKPVVFQVVSVVDISESLYNQYRELKVADDDSSFNDPSEGSFELVTEVSKNVKVLKVELSDGELTLTGIITETISFLNINTSPGTKILLIPRIMCRNRCIRLKPNNCQVLGGNCERLIQENWPIMKVLCRKLNINYETASNKNKTKIINIFEQNDKVPRKVETENKKPTSPKPKTVRKTNKKTELIKMPCLSTSKNQINSLGPMDKYLQSLIVESRPLLNSKSTEKPSVMEDLTQKLVIREPNVHLIFPEPVKNALPLEQFKQQTTKLLDSVIVVPHDTKNESDFDLEDPKPTVSASDTLFDGDILPVLERKTKASKIDFTPPPVKKKEQMENPIIKKFSSLNICKIGEILAKRKYFLKPEIRIIMPLMCRSGPDMTFKDNLWVYCIFVTDESIADIKMNVDPSVIDELLGFTLAFALKAASGNNLAEKENCRQKAIAFANIFKNRLDLILHVEFSPDSLLIPVVKKVDYLANLLEIG